MAGKKYKILFSQACEGMIRYKAAVGMSDHTITDYKISFRKLAAFLKEDLPLQAITRDKIVGFFAYLQSDYITDPDGAAPRGKRKLGQKSILNIHTNLSALWEWAKEEGYVKENLLRSIKRPAVIPKVISEFSKEEIQALLKACDNSHSWKTKPVISNTRPTALRDRVIILLLLDTGLRANELCTLIFGNIDFAKNKIKVIGKGRGREGKERIVVMGRRTSQLLWNFLLPRIETIKPDDLVFLVGHPDSGNPMTIDVLRKLVYRVGVRAGVRNVHPHRFRHTFAVNFLRFGGNLFALQELLGHTTLTMVRRYARLAEVDIEAAHRIAGPVDHLRL
jgi:integrase/recombinase XerD